MSDFGIRDGAGRGYGAMVTEGNRLLVDGVAHGLSHKACHEGNNFICHVGDPTVPVTTTEGYLMIICNDHPTLPLLPKRFIGSTLAGIDFNIRKNVKIGTLGAHTEFDAVNLNFAAANPAQASVNIWDGTGTGITGVTNGDLVTPFRVPAAAGISVDFQDDWMVPPGSNIAISGKAFSGTAAVQLIIPFYFHNFDSRVV